MRHIPIIAIGPFLFRIAAHSYQLLGVNAKNSIVRSGSRSSFVLFENVVHVHRRILFSYIEKWNHKVCRKMHGPRKYTTWGNPGLFYVWILDLNLYWSKYPEVTTEVREVERDNGGTWRSSFWDKRLGHGCLAGWKGTVGVLTGKEGGRVKQKERKGGEIHNTGYFWHNHRETRYFIRRFKYASILNWAMSHAVIILPIRSHKLSNKNHQF